MAIENDRQWMFFLPISIPDVHDRYMANKSIFNYQISVPTNPCRAHGRRGSGLFIVTCTISARPTKHFSHNFFASFFTFKPRLAYSNMEYDWHLHPFINVIVLKDGRRFSPFSRPRAHCEVRKSHLWGGINNSCNGKIRVRILYALCTAAWVLARGYIALSGDFDSVFEDCE